MTKPKSRPKGTVDEPSPGGARRFQIVLTEDDYQAMEFLKTRYLYGALVDTLRYSLREQVRRSLREPSSRAERAATKKHQESARAIKNRVGGVSNRHWSCWFTPQDFEWIAKIGEKYNLKSGESIRFALRVQAQLDGYVFQE